VRLLVTLDYIIIAGIAEEKGLYQHYGVSLPSLAFKTLLQNFARFLHIVNGVGHIIVESSTADRLLTEEYYRLMFAGGKFMNAKGFQDVLKDITFYEKSKLNEGLQVVDFIANPISRMICNLTPFKPLGFADSPYPSILAQKIYKGPTNDPYEYGVRKVMI